MIETIKSLEKFAETLSAMLGILLQYLDRGMNLMLSRF